MALNQQITWALQEAEQRYVTHWRESPIIPLFQKRNKMNHNHDHDENCPCGIHDQILAGVSPEEAVANFRQ